MNAEIKKKMETAIREEMKSRLGWDQDKAGYFVWEVDAYYDDEMSDKTAIEILQSDDPYYSFHEKLWEWYWEEESSILWDIQRDIRNAITSEDGAYPEGLSEEESYALEVLLGELFYVSLPEDHYLKQSFPVNIMLDTGDGNYDYTLNSVFPSCYGRYEDRLHDKASIVWLARQQGYTKTQLWKALREEDVASPEGFLESMRQEVANIASHMATVTFLVEMTLKDLIELNRLIKRQDRDGRRYDATKNPNCGYIIIGKEAEAGLYDPWHGGGSVLELQLVQDVKLPIKFIRSALPDGGDGYEIQDVYGLCSCFWEKGQVKKIHCPKSLRER